MAGVIEEFDLSELNEQFEQTEPQKIVAWAAARFDGDAVMSSSFGAESAVMLHMVTRVLPRIKVIFVNTGFIFAETHLFMEQLRRRLDLNVWTYRTRNDPREYLHRAGEDNPAWRKDIDACCAANKNEPFERAMKELTPRAWLRGIRRDQASTRHDRRFLEHSSRYNCLAISPLLNWKSRDVHGYLKKHDLPYHPLWEKGYTSIGCNPLSCTRPIQIGADPRSGRWAEAEKLECGINITSNSLDSANL
jgi:phosphoadenosine phosphosulfate reductase